MANSSTYFELMPPEMNYELLLAAKPQDLINFCASSVNLSDICREENQHFWKLKVQRDYGELVQYPDQTWYEIWYRMTYGYTYEFFYAYQLSQNSESVGYVEEEFHPLLECTSPNDDLRCVTPDITNVYQTILPQSFNRFLSSQEQLHVGRYDYIPSASEIFNSNSKIQFTPTSVVVTLYPKTSISDTNMAHYYDYLDELLRLSIVDGPEEFMPSYEYDKTSLRGEFYQNDQGNMISEREFEDLVDQWDELDDEEKEVNDDPHDEYEKYEFSTLLTLIDIYYIQQYVNVNNWRFRKEFTY